MHCILRIWVIWIDWAHAQINDQLISDSFWSFKPLKNYVSHDMCKERSLLFHFQRHGHVREGNGLNVYTSKSCQYFSISKTSTVLSARFMFQPPKKYFHFQNFHCLLFSNM